MRSSGCSWWRPSLLAVSRVLAQTVTATIRGTVSDPTGGVIAGPRSRSRNEETGLIRTTETELRGHLHLRRSCPSAPTAIEVEHPGFKSGGAQQDRAERRRRARGRRRSSQTGD